jgi:hypothetical protein
MFAICSCPLLRLPILTRRWQRIHSLFELAIPIATHLLAPLHPFVTSHIPAIKSDLRQSRTPNECSASWQAARHVMCIHEVEVDPISRTPYCSFRRSPRCPIPNRRTRRNFVSSWSSWFVPARSLQSWPKSLAATPAVFWAGWDWQVLPVA